jgi:hypothetical protein
MGPNFGGTPGRCRPVPGSATPSQDPWCVRGLVLLGRLATDRLCRCCTVASPGRRTEPQDCEVTHHVRGGHAGDPEAYRGPLRLPGQEAAAGTYGPEESGRSPVVGWANSCHTVAWFTLGRRWRCKVPGDCS